MKAVVHRFSPLCFVSCKKSSLEFT